jgi:hypothetical protein
VGAGKGTYYFKLSEKNYQCFEKWNGTQVIDFERPEQDVCNLFVEDKIKMRVKTTSLMRGFMLRCCSTTKRGGKKQVKWS